MILWLSLDIGVLDTFLPTWFCGYFKLLLNRCLITVSFKYASFSKVISNSLKVNNSIKWKKQLQKHTLLENKSLLLSWEHRSAKSMTLFDATVSSARTVRDPKLFLGPPRPSWRRKVKLRLCLVSICHAKPKRGAQNIMYDKLLLKATSNPNSP